MPELRPPSPSAVNTLVGARLRPASRTLAGFEAINRYLDPAEKRFCAKILPGEYYVTMQDELIATTLGSCVSACVRDPLAGVGGMNHFMLPDGDGSVVSASNRYGSYAMENLINTLLKHGATRSRLEVKITGGGQLMGGIDVGARNVGFVREFLRLEGLKLLSEDVLGDQPRKVLFDPITGRLRVKKLNSLKNDTLQQREISYRRQLSKAQAVDASDVELF